MKPSSDLYALIHTLSSTEKNYIKKYAGVYGKNKHNYYKLLEAISKQEEYDEKALLIKFRKESFVKHFAVTKNQLMELILKLLRQFHQKNSIHATINAAIENARLLYERGLSSLAFKQLDKGYKLAEEYAEYTRMEEITDLKRHFIDQLKAYDWREEMDALLSTKETLLRSELEYVEYARAYYKLLFLVRKYNQLRNKEQKQELEEIVPLLKLSAPQYSNHIYSQLLHLNVKSIYYYLTKEFDLSTKCTIAVLDVWDEYPKIRQKNVEHYIAAINSNMNLGIVNTDFSVFELSFSRLKNIQQDSIRIEAMVFQHENKWLINYYQLQKKYSELLELAPTFIQKLNRLKGSMDSSNYLFTLYSVALIYFICGKYNKAIEHLNMLLDIKKTSLKSDIYLFANMMLLFAHYRIGNFLFLENALKNYRRKLQKKDLLYDFEYFEIKALSNLCKAPNRTEVIKALDLIKENLEEILIKNPALQTSLYGHFNLKTWIKSVKQNCTMQVIYEKGKNSWEQLNENSPPSTSS